MPRLPLPCLLALAALLGVLQAGVAVAAPEPACPKRLSWPTDPTGELAALYHAEITARPGAIAAVGPLLRLAELAPDLPFGALDGALCQVSADRRTHPLVAAEALWLRHEQALQSLQMDAARALARRLGLLTAFVVRTGAAPHPTAPLLQEPTWQALAPHAGEGELWLEALLRPAHNTTATLATRLVSPKGGPAVLRLGYDDTVKVWLNGDEVFVGDQAHHAALDQAAVPVVLRPGDNRLIIEIAQESGAWRALVRLTDAAGAALPGLEAHPDPWGPVPEPAEGEAPATVAALYTDLRAAAEVEQPTADALRDYADYARHAHLPEPDLTHPRVVAEQAFELDPSPSSLETWLRLLPEEERPAVRANHPLARPVRRIDHLVDLRLRVADARRHYFARRHADTRATLDALRAEHPNLGPARALWALFLQDLGLPNRAVTELSDGPGAPSPPQSVAHGKVMALRAAGRPLEALAVLAARVQAGQGNPDDRYHLASLHAARGETAAALAALDAVSTARPELLSFALEAVEVLDGAGQRETAIARLLGLAERLPEDGHIAERLARLYAATGDTEHAIERLTVAVRVRPEDELLAGWLAELKHAPAAAPAAALAMGPPIAALLATPDPAGAAAHVLYHHAQAEVGADGRAVRRLRRVVRILTEEGARRFGEWELSYVPTTQRLTVHRAQLLRPGAPPATPRHGDRDLSEPDYRLYFDLRAEVLTFDRPQPGDVIEVVWSLADTDDDPSFPDYFGEVAWLQESTPRAHSVVEVTGAAAPRIQASVVAPGLDVQREGLRFEAHNVPGVVSEPGMPGPSSLRAYVHLSTLSDWTEAADRYRKLVADRLVPTDRLRELARTWAGDAKTPEAIIAALYTEVAHRTRYVGLEFGVRSFQPASPAQTLARGFGDCKDKATLLIALARALDVEAHLVLVRTRGAGAIAPGVASFAVFDHAIVYVPALDRFLDPTVDRNDPFTLPPSDQGAMVLVVDDHPAPRVAPADPAAANTARWHLDLQVSPTGGVEGTVTWTNTGHPATVVRRAIEGEGARREYVEQALAARFPGATLRDLAVSGLDPARDPVVVTAQVRLPALTRGADGGWRWPVGGAPWQLVAGYAQSADRINPLELEVRSQRALVVDLHLPEGSHFDAPTLAPLTAPFGALSVTVGRANAEPTKKESDLPPPKAGAVRVAVTFVLSTARVEPADYPAFRAWLAAADRALATGVSLSLRAAGAEGVK